MCELAFFNIGQLKENKQEMFAGDHALVCNSQSQQSVISDPYLKSIWVY